MIEWHLARFILGAAQLGLALSIRMRRIGYLFWFAVFLWWSAATNIAPAFPRSEAYKQVVQVPAYLIALALTITATVDAFRFLPRRTFPQERRLLLAFAVIAGMLPVVMGWLFRPDNWYQAVMLGRQYALLGTAIGFCAAWMYVAQLRPLVIPATAQTHGYLWGAWLLCTVGLASTTKGGLLWQLTEWKGAHWDWRAVSVYLMAAQLVILWRVSVNLRSWPAAVPSVRSYPHARQQQPQSDSSDLSLV